MPSRHHLYYLYSASESEEEEEEEEYDPYDHICWVNQQEQDFFNEIAYGPFLNFHYRIPHTTSWNKPKKKRLRVLLHPYLDNNTLDRICPKKDIIKNGLATLDVMGQGRMHLTNDDINRLFYFANRWCVIHETKCISWVVFCIVQFSCI
tara:strand:- start:1689 stop:2135 length:447 start_codon:yes stop_codon:yes gene_type:complete